MSHKYIRKQNIVKLIWRSVTWNWSVTVKQKHGCSSKVHCKYICRGRWSTETHLQWFYIWVSYSEVRAIEQVKNNFFICFCILEPLKSPDLSWKLWLLQDNLKLVDWNQSLRNPKSKQLNLKIHPENEKGANKRGQYLFVLKANSSLTAPHPQRGLKWSRWEVLKAWII